MKKQTKGKLLKIEEVALMLNVSTKTINNWYWWARQHPEHELAQLLPEYTQEGERQTRLWESADIWKLVEFKTKLPRGRNGILGSVTQKYTSFKHNEID